MTAQDRRRLLLSGWTRLLGAGAAATTLLAAPLLTGTLVADTIQVSVHPITNTTNAHETTPTVGTDGITKVVIYSRSELVGGVPRPADIYYQRTSDEGVRMGSPIRVSNDVGESSDDRLNDTNGNRIVYTALEAGTSQGILRVYDLSDNSTIDLIEEADTVREARIHGTIVAWVQGPPGSTHIAMVDLAWTDLTPVILSGSDVATGVEVGSRYVVWEERVTPATQMDIVAYDLTTGTIVEVSADPVTEQGPATFGDWIVWQRSDSGTSLWAKNVGAGETAFSIAATAAPAQVRNPSIDGDLIAYETNSSGNFDVYVFRIGEGATYQVTNGSTDEILNSVYEDLIAFVDVAAMAPFDHDVEVAHLAFLSEPPLPCPGVGDADGDGVCDNVDNCPATPNPDQADIDGDGIGDSCDPCGVDPDSDGVCAPPDNCPSIANTDQLDLDADGIGDACDATPLGDPPDDPCATDTTPPVLTVPPSIVTNATQPDGANVAYTATATDDQCGPATLACSPASASLFPIATTQVACSATDGAGNTSQASFSVTVRGAPEQIVALLEKLRGMSFSALHKAKLTFLLQALLANPHHKPLVCETLRFFIVLVEQASGRHIPAELAAELVNDARRIRSVVGCQ